MAKQVINLGTAPSGQNGDTSRVANIKIISNFDELYARAQGFLPKNIAGAAGVVALTDAELLNGLIDLTGAITGDRVLTVDPANKQAWIFRNSTTGAFKVTVKTTNGAGVDLASGASVVLFCDGAKIVDPVAGAIAADATEKIGTVRWMAYNGYGAPLPTGYVKANGAALSRTVYAKAFAKLGVVFGAGDGSTTFNIPDLRGEFIRGWDDSRGINAGRAFGVLELGDIQNHTHTIPNYIPTGSFTQTGTSVTLANNNGNNYVTGSAGGSETRPRNIALLAIIKVF